MFLDETGQGIFIYKTNFYFKILHGIELEMCVYIF